MADGLPLARATTTSRSPATWPPCGTTRRNDEPTHPSVLVEDQPGVLARISALLLAPRVQHRLARRGSHRAVPGISRMTIVVNRRGAAARAGHQAAQQAGQRAEDRRAEPESAVQRELLVVKARRHGEPPPRRRDDQLSAAKSSTSARDRHRSRPPAATSRVLPKVLEPHGIKRLAAGDGGDGPAPRSITADRSSVPPSGPPDPPGAVPASGDFHRIPARNARESSPWPVCSTTTTPTSIIAGKKVVVTARQPGHAHSLNLRDSGIDVRVGLLEAPASRAGRGRGPADPDQMSPSRPIAMISRDHEVVSHEGPTCRSAVLRPMAS